MATKKNINSRKALAVALGIMGVAGLSLASAAQLTVNTSNEVALGVAAFGACDDEVSVSYEYSTTTLEITDILIDDIDAACNGIDIFFTLDDAAATPVELAAGSGTVAAGAYTYDATGDNISIETDLGDITVVIG